MKYIGENAITKLISLIKGDLATKQDSIAATGVLERDTTGVINGVETVGATLVETQEATLVDVPNGLLKGDGTTISQAVAGTDYVNSSQAIRYDAAQTLTDAQKTQARANIAAAPDGFGLGGIVANIPEGANLNDYILTGFFGNVNTSTIKTWVNVPLNWPANEAILEVYTLGSYLIQRLSSVSTGVSAQRSLIGNAWTEWEWVNPPMQLGVEYRTTERYLGKPVYAKAVNVSVLPSAGSFVSPDHNIANFGHCVECSGSLENGTSLPYVNTNKDGQILLGVNSNNIRIYSDIDLSALTAVVKIKYTKTTD